MFLGDYTSDTLTLGAVQFASGIALDFLGETEASSAVIQFLGGKASSAESILTLTGDRRDFEKRLSEGSTNFVSSFIDFLWEQKVLVAVSKETRVSRVLGTCSLSDLVKHVSKKQLYAEAMRILMRHPADKLIHVFIHTNRFKEVFSITIRKNFAFSRDGVRRNDLSDSIINELLDDFADWVFMYSSSGAYSLDSGTPVAFLLHTFNNMYQYSYKANLFKILNTRGQNTEITEDQGTTALDMVGISDSVRTDSFDFVSVCTKINRASYLLFSHAGNTVAFYDIFSCYFDNVTLSKVEEKKKVLKMLQGCSFTVSGTVSEGVSGHEGAIANKKAGRVSICRLMERILTNGIRREDVYRLYKDVIVKTEALPTKDGARLFSTAGYATRHRENNSQMFQIIFDGYVALKELLEFLGTVKKSKLESPARFPVRIFRDSAYLRRFRTFDEYVQYEKYVESLCDEVARDYARTLQNDEGFYSNDAVFNMLSSQKVVNSGIFARLHEMPLAYIASAVSSITSKSDKENLCTELDELSATFVKLKAPKDFSARAYVTMGYVQALRSLVQLSSSIYQQGKPVEISLAQYPKYFAFCNCLKRVMELEGHSVSDGDDNYLPESDSVLQEFLYVKTLAGGLQNEQAAKLVSNSYTLRVVAIHYVYQAFTGIDKFEDSISTMGWSDLRNVFCINELLQSYVSKMSDYLQRIYFGENSLFLTLACAAQDLSLVEVSTVVKECDDFMPLYDSQTSQYRIYKHKNRARASEYNAERNHKLVIAYNRLMVLLSEKFETFSRLKEQIYTSIKTTNGSSNSLDVEIESILREATHYLELKYNIATCEPRVLKNLETFSFDSLGLLMVGAHRACGRGTLFYHKRGYVIEVNRYSKTYSYHVMTDADLNDIKSITLGG